MKLLIVEDNPRLVEDMQGYLHREGYVVETAMTYEDASEKLFLYDYDLTIIDIGLPDGSGLDLVRELKEAQREVSILILTAKDAIEDKVEGLNLGADDYMTKPFHKSELNARMHSILRRNTFNHRDIMKINELKIDLPSSQAYVNDTPLDLTRKEYDLLIYLMQNADRIVTKESIAEHLWGDHIDQADSFDFIYNHIKNLRKKVVQAGGNNYIHAKYGMGYIFETQAGEHSS